MTTPDDGHTFRFTMVTRGSYAVEGDAHHVDAEAFDVDLPWTLEVRAWDLPTALRLAAEAPLASWTKPLLERRDLTGP